ncbi:MAG: accessory factor associated with RNA polymerase II [Marteilia pararefringens]
MLLDVLTLLRQTFLKHPDSIEQLSNNQIKLGDLQLPKDAKTNYLVWRTAQDDEEKSYYTLDSIVYLLKNSNQPHTIYVRHAMENGIPVIRRPDRKDLLSFLNGEIDSSASIDKDIKFDVNINEQDNQDSGNKSLKISDKGAKLIKNGGVNSTDSDIDASSSIKDSSDSIKSSKIGSEESKNTVLSIDKIASLKAKFQKQKQIQKKNEIAPHDEDELKDIKLADSTTVSMFIDSIVTKMKRTRKSVTRATNSKDFNRSLASVISVYKQNETSGVSNESHSKVSKDYSEFGKNLLEFKAQTGYNRYDQEKFSENQELLQLGIVPGVSKSMKVSSLANTESRSINERKVKRMSPDRSLNVSFGDEIKENRIREIVPIIVVPPKSLSPMIGLHNIKSFLENFTFTSANDSNPDQSSSNNNNSESTNSLNNVNQFHNNQKIINISRPSLLPPNEYYKRLRIVEKPLTDIDKNDWKYVVCVFVHGPSWQFKGWPFPGGQSEIFSKVKALHACFSDSIVNENITKWNIETLNLSRLSRHNDFAIIQKLWTDIDSHVNKIIGKWMFFYIPN